MRRTQTDDAIGALGIQLADAHGRQITGVEVAGMGQQQHARRRELQRRVLEVLLEPLLQALGIGRIEVSRYGGFPGHSHEHSLAGARFGTDRGKRPRALEL